MRPQRGKNQLGIFHSLAFVVSCLLPLLSFRYSSLPSEAIALLCSIPLFIVTYEFGLLWGAAAGCALAVGASLFPGLGGSGIYFLMILLPAAYVRWRQRLLEADCSLVKQHLEENITVYNKKIAELQGIVDREAFNATAIYEFTSILGSTLHYQETLNLMVDTILRIVPYDACCLFLLDDEADELYIEVARGLSGAGKETRGQSILVKDYERDTRFQPLQFGHKFASVLSLPLITKGKIIGVLEVLKEEPSAFDNNDLRILTIIANQAAFSIRNANLYSQVMQQAITDPVTGLANHRYFKEVLAKEFQRATRYGRELSLLLLDLDHFKEINDAHGHQIGDRVLTEFSRQLTAMIRDNVDLAARYGGEEFCVILPETGLGEALKIAERIRRRVAEKHFADCLKLTVSIGVATFPQHAETSEQLIKAADLACYQAKHRGRNLIMPAE
jgi:diguanylate cyclase (GGDEF)-like protein